LFWFNPLPDVSGALIQDQISIFAQYFVSNKAIENNYCGAGLACSGAGAGVGVVRRAPRLSWVLTA
jgi:hypothetical protein